MTEKFTEKQYQEIVALSKDRPENRDEETTLVFNYIYSEFPFIGKYSDMYNKGLAIYNPLTRELAHDKYVEEEEKYYWFTKKLTAQGEPLNLLHGAGGIVQMMGPLELLTKSEVVEWGFKPNNFNFTSDKEEALAYSRGEK